MRVAVLSDVHGNRHALEAVLEDVAGADVAELWCLGDVVGYGADPNDCVDLVRERCALSLAGNHDLAVTGHLSLDDFSRGAALAAKWTTEVLAPERVEWLAGLKASGTRGGAGLYHGSPRDPVWEYVISSLLADLCLDVAPERVCIVGHSHVALAFRREEGKTAIGERCYAGDDADLAEGRWLLNPGSVGQPRDGDPRAAWLLLDLEARRCEWKRVRYDVAGAAKAIRAARLPESLAERLEYGQ